MGTVGPQFALLLGSCSRAESVTGQLHLEPASPAAQGHTGGEEGMCGSLSVPHPAPFCLSKALG